MGELLLGLLLIVAAALVVVAVVAVVLGLGFAGAGAWALEWLYDKLVPRRGVSAAGQELVGELAEVSEAFAGGAGRLRGVVLLRGERWSAELSRPSASPNRGAWVRVVAVRQLTLVVEPLEDARPERG